MFQEPTELAQVLAWLLKRNYSLSVFAQFAHWLALFFRACRNFGTALKTVALLSKISSKTTSSKLLSSSAMSKRRKF